jgi:hypothetical protein
MAGLSDLRDLCNNNVRCTDEDGRLAHNLSESELVLERYFEKNQ